MTNGSNLFGVSFAQIKWIEGVIKKHPNTNIVTRKNDIVFEISRHRGRDVSLVCLEEYTCGLARVYEALDAFPDASILYVGGVWNGYTREAKEFCIEAQIGLYNTGEINGALHHDEFWKYYKRDKYGNPTYPYRAA